MSERRRDVRLEVESLEPSLGLRRRVLASVDPSTRFEGLVERVAGFLDLAPSAAREILRAADAATGWEATPIAGVRLYHFRGGPRVASFDCGLVAVDPGAAVPRHRHLGAEWSFVLAGSAQEEGGERWEAGDIVMRPPASTHGFRALGAEPFLFAVVLMGGIEPVDS
jgi:quercetin dioxygenase-like cupin family protein